MVKITGADLIDTLANRLKDKNIPPHDGAILTLLRSMSFVELSQATVFGDVVSWRNERILKENPELYEENRE